MVRGPSATTRSHIWCFLQDKLNSACYIAQIVNPVLLPLHRQEGDVIFQQDNIHPHMAATMQHALHDIQQLPWSTRTPDLSPIQNVWVMLKGNLLFLQSLPKSLPNCDNGCKMLGTIYSRMSFGTFMTVCMPEYTPALLPEEGIDVTVWHGQLTR